MLRHYNYTITYFSIYVCFAALGIQLIALYMKGKLHPQPFLEILFWVRLVLTWETPALAYVAGITISG